MSQLSLHDQAVLNCVFNPNLPIGEASEKDEPKDTEECTSEVLATKSMEIEAIQVAEKGDLNKGLNILNEAIKIAPKRPSLFNNRANVYQYMRQFEDAFDDLTTAIALCTEHHQKTLCQAHCQRGVLHKRADRIELARADFEKAAELGSKFAKSQLIELNPYAALCNQMLRKVMEKLN
ncbi:unnamed protein product [Ceutorhynchus assimilis]|uniref:Tetratricopeptide repeat protein 36 n=1 Tax=Ceutorhynchus assimilis TaxID=467358 RepID=A0A9N9MZY0_9CUCU|nr:unnamed protein product [Ceutorhynchus assimilis]